jgi:hypothetical protein
MGTTLDRFLRCNAGVPMSPVIENGAEVLDLVEAHLVTECPLYPVRPVTCKSLPVELLRYWHIDPDVLDDRARTLVSQEKADSGVSPDNRPKGEPSIKEGGMWLGVEE